MEGDEGFVGRERGGTGGETEDEAMGVGFGGGVFW